MSKPHCVTSKAQLQCSFNINTEGVCGGPSAVLSGMLPLSTHQKIESQTFDENMTLELGHWGFRALK